MHEDCNLKVHEEKVWSKYGRQTTGLLRIKLLDEKTIDQLELNLTFS